METWSSFKHKDYFEFYSKKLNKIIIAILISAFCMQQNLIQNCKCPLHNLTSKFTFHNGKVYKVSEINNVLEKLSSLFCMNLSVDAKYDFYMIHVKKCLLFHLQHLLKRFMYINNSMCQQTRRNCYKVR